MIRFLLELFIFPYIFSAPIILVGNKTDLQMERKISTEEGKKLAQSWNAQFVEVSAKQLLVSLHHLTEIEPGISYGQEGPGGECISCTA